MKTISIVASKAKELVMGCVCEFVVFNVRGAIGSDYSQGTRLCLVNCFPVFALKRSSLDHIIDQVLDTA